MRKIHFYDYLRRKLKAVAWIFVCKIILFFTLRWKTIEKMLYIFEKNFNINLPTSS